VQLLIAQMSLCIAAHDCIADAYCLFHLCNLLRDFNFIQLLYHLSLDTDERFIPKAVYLRQQGEVYTGNFYYRFVPVC